MVTRMRIDAGTDTHEFKVYNITNILKYDEKTIAQSLGIGRGSGEFRILAEIINETRELAANKLSIISIAKMHEIVGAIGSQA